MFDNSKTMEKYSLESNIKPRPYWSHVRKQKYIA